MRDIKRAVALGYRQIERPNDSWSLAVELFLATYWYAKLEPDAPWEFLPRDWFLIGFRIGQVLDRLAGELEGGHFPEYWDVIEDASS